MALVLGASTVLAGAVAVAALGERSVPAKPAAAPAVESGAAKPPAPAAPPKAEPKNGNGTAAEPGAQLGEFVVNIGTTHRGKRVADLPAPALVWFAEKMAATTADAQATKEACARYLAAHPEARPPAGGNGVKAPVPA